MIGVRDSTTFWTVLSAVAYELNEKRRGSSAGSLDSRS